MRASLLLFLLFAGCAHFPTVPTEAARLVGTYSDGYHLSPRTLELNADGTFSYSQSSDVEGLGWAFFGSWSPTASDKIDLTTNNQPPKITVYARRSRKYGIVILEPELNPGILKTWSDDDFRPLRKE